MNDASNKHFIYKDAASREELNHHVIKEFCLNKSISHGEVVWLSLQ
jgi:hypothetical protein